MKKIICIIVFLLLTTSCFADDYFSYENKMKRRIDAIQKEIAHYQRMKELELQYKIYAAELELKKQNININNSITNKNYNRNRQSTKVED